MKELDEIKETITSPFLITVVGEFSSGKSTFINALIGRKFLPMKVKPTTATITLLTYSEDEYLEVYYENGYKEKYPLSDIEKFVVENYVSEEKVLKNIFYVKVGIPCKILKHFDIADTPGFNSPIERHSQITKDFFSYSDLVFWVFDASQLCKMSEINIIKEYCKDVYRPIAIVNKMDNVESQIDKETESIDKIKKEYKEMLDNFVDEVFFVSAKDALQNGKNNKNGFNEIHNYIEKTIISTIKKRKKEIIKSKIEKILGDINSKIYSPIVDKLSGIIKDIDNVDKDIETCFEKEKRLSECISLWNKNVKDLNYIGIMEDISRYFPVMKVDNLYIEQSKIFLRDYNQLNAELREMQNERKNIEASLKELNSELELLEKRIEEYRNRYFGLKAFWDCLCGDVTKEKISINNDCYLWEKKRIHYNNRVDSYNKKMDIIEKKFIKWEEAFRLFVSDVAEAINKQIDYLKDLFEKLLEMRAYQIQEMHEYEKVYNKFNTKDIRYVLKYFGYKTFDDIFYLIDNYNRKELVYSRNILDTIVNNNLSKKKFSEEEEWGKISYENRQTPKID